MKRILILFNAFILIVAFWGCSGSSKLIKNKDSAKKKQAGIINEYFDPLILKDDDLKVKKTISDESKSDRIDDVLDEAGQERQIVEEVTGFRVQICAVSDEEKAREIQRKAILKLIDEEVNLKYDSPYYKVRVGNCLTRYEADKLQQLASEKGFGDAWVVRTKVKNKRIIKSPLNNQNNSPK